MPISQHGRFVRLPTELVDAFLRVQLTRTQLRILLWVIRYTYGWNRCVAPFSWYHIAACLEMDRGGIVRAGHALVQARILNVREHRIGIQQNSREWTNSKKTDDARHLWISQAHADRNHRKPMTSVIESDDSRHRFSVEGKT